MTLDPKIQALLKMLLNFFNNTLRIHRPVDDNPRNKKMVRIGLDHLKPMKLTLEKNRGGLLARFKMMVNDAGRLYPGKFTAVPALVSADFEQFAGQDIWYAVAFPGLSEASVLNDDRLKGQVPIWPLLAEDSNKLRYRRYLEVSFRSEERTDRGTDKKKIVWIGRYHGKAVVWKGPGSPYDKGGESGVKVTVIFDEAPRMIFAKKIASDAEIKQGPWETHDSASQAKGLLSSDKAAKEICADDEIALSKGGKLNIFALFGLTEDALTEDVNAREAGLKIRSKRDYDPDSDPVTKVMREAGWEGGFNETYRERTRLLKAVGKELRQLTLYGDEVRLSNKIVIKAGMVFGGIKPHTMHTAEVNALAASKEFGGKHVNALKTVDQIVKDPVIVLMIKEGWEPTSADPKDLRKVRKAVIEVARKVCLRQVLADDEFYHQLVGSTGGGPLKALAVLGFATDFEGISDNLVIETVERLLEIKSEDVTEDHPTVKEFRRVGQTDRDFTNPDRGFKDLLLAGFNAGRHLVDDQDAWVKRFGDNA